MCTGSVLVSVLVLVGLLLVALQSPTGTSRTHDYWDYILVFRMYVYCTDTGIQGTVGPTVYW